MDSQASGCLTNHDGRTAPHLRPLTTQLRQARVDEVLDVLGQLLGLEGTEKYI